MVTPTSFSIRRRYQQVDYRPVRMADKNLWQIYLDERPLKTPAGHAALCPTEALAIAAVAEWQAQGEQIKPQLMPINQLLMTALDRIPETRATLIAELLRYLTTELICYYSTDERLLALERQHWQPLHAWVAETFGTVLPVTFGVIPTSAVIPTAPFESRLQHYDDYQLAALAVAVAASSSLVIALALIERRLDAPAALAAAEVEVDWQASQWGEDPAAAARRAAVAADLHAASTFVQLLVSAR